MYWGAALSLLPGGGALVGCSGVPNAAAWCPSTHGDPPAGCRSVAPAGGCPRSTVGMAELGDGSMGLACGEDGFPRVRPRRAPLPIHIITCQSPSMEGGWRAAIADMPLPQSTLCSFRQTLCGG